MKKRVKSIEKVLKPKINNLKLTKEVLVTDENKKKIKMHSVVERPLTLFLNKQEIVTMMTICDYPCLLYTSPSPRDKRKSRMPSSA